MEAEKATSRKSVIVVTTASGEDIEDEIVEMYFENKKKSGGGAIKSYIKKDQQMIITFQDEEGMIVSYGCYITKASSEKWAFAGAGSLCGHCFSRNGVLFPKSDRMQKEQKYLSIQCRCGFLTVFIIIHRERSGSLDLSQMLDQGLQE